MNEPLEVTKERNEKNIAFRKRLKNTYICVYGIPVVLLLVALSLKAYSELKTAVYILLTVMAILLIVWFLCCLILIPTIRCPHCKSFLGRRDPWNIPKCPQCGTSLEILEFSEENQLYYKKND